MRPMRSPRITRVEKSRTTTAVAERLDDPRRPRTPVCRELSAASTAIRTVPDLRAAGGPLGAHLHQPLHAALVARAPGLDAPAQPHLFLGQLLVELLVGHRLAVEPLLLLAQERGVVAGPRGELAAIELDDARGQPLEERAVVGHEQHGAGVVGEERLEPLDGLDVEVVGRLVEQQHVGRGHQRPRQQHAPPPSARQRVDHGASAGSASRVSTSSTRCSSRQPSRSSSSCCRRPSRSSAAASPCATSTDAW